MSQSELRCFTLGMMAGIAIFIGSFAAVSWHAGLKWQPVKIGPTADQLFGCTQQDTTPSGECR